MKVYRFHGDLTDISAKTKPLLTVTSLSQVDLLEFDYRKMRFECDMERFVFEKVRFPTRDPIVSYLTSNGFKADADALGALEKWGANRVEVPVPQFLMLLQEQMIAPFFCFQVSCLQ